MKLPANIATRNKIRDAKICVLYADGNKTQAEIAEQFNLSARRIGAILYNNIEFLKSNKEWEKSKRIIHLKRLLNTHPDSLGKKGTLEILEQLREETEGTKSSQAVSVVVNVMQNVVKDDVPVRYRLGDAVSA